MSHERSPNLSKPPCLLCGQAHEGTDCPGMTELRRRVEALVEPRRSPPPDPPPQKIDLAHLHCHAADAAELAALRNVLEAARVEPGGGDSLVNLLYQVAAYLRASGDGPMAQRLLIAGDSMRDAIAEADKAREKEPTP